MHFRHERDVIAVFREFEVVNTACCLGGAGRGKLCVNAVAYYIAVFSAVVIPVPQIQQIRERDMTFTGRLQVYVRIPA